MPLDAAQKELEVRRSLIEDLAERSENLVYSRACDLNAEQFPDHPALIDRNNRLNWSDVKSISDRLAMALLESNVMRPDIALIHLSNSAEQFLIRLACEKAGVRVLLTNSAFRETELASLIERTRPAVAFVSAEKAGRGDYDRLLEMLGAAGTKLQLILVGGGTQTEWARSYEALLAEAPQVYARILDRTRFDWDERFYLTTTSGSTSAPKIADTIYGRRIWLSLRHAAGVKLQMGETIAALPPMTSGTADSLIHHAAPYFAATIVLENRFDPVGTSQLLVDENVHVATAVPAMLARMLAHDTIDQLSDAPLRCFATYAAAISYELGAAVEERACCGIVRCYGTMDFGGISMSTLDDDRHTRIRTVGRPFVDNDLKIVDEQGADVPAGAPGEIVMRPSRVVMGGGYFRDYRNTAKVWSEDYYRLGDLGQFDDRGNLILVGRASELIIRGGQNILPSEVEELMIAHPKVIDVAVVGLPDKEMGETVCACVIIEGDSALELDDVRSHFDALGVARFKCPERIVRFDEFPVTMSGMKVDRRQLIETLGGRS